VNPRPWDALFNDALAHELFHMYLAGYLVTGFIVAGVYAAGWLRGRRDLYMRTALIVPLSFACLTAPVQVIVGDWAARSVGERQPVKLAAFEGLTRTTEGAPFTLGGVFDEDEQRVRWGIEIPHLLSVLAKGSPARSRGQPLHTYLTVLKDDDMCWFCLLYSVTFGGYIGLGSFLPTFFHDHYGIAAIEAGYLTALLALVGSALRPVSDKEDSLPIEKLELPDSYIKVVGCVRERQVRDLSKESV